MKYDPSTKTLPEALKHFLSYIENQEGRRLIYHRTTALKTERDKAESLVKKCEAELEAIKREAELRTQKRQAELLIKKYDTELRDLEKELQALERQEALRVQKRLLDDSGSSSKVLRSTRKRTKTGCQKFA